MKTMPDREEIMSRWDTLANMLRENKSGSSPRDIFESIIDDFFEIYQDPEYRELCKCLTKTPEWEYHRTYCPVWKNGRIAKLEELLERLANITKAPVTNRTARRYGWIIGECEELLGQ